LADKSKPFFNFPYQGGCSKTLQALPKKFSKSGVLPKNLQTQEKLFAPERQVRQLSAVPSIELKRLLICLILAGLLSSPSIAATPVQPARVESVHPIKPPKKPLPSEEDSDGLSQFSFLVYGDTRGRRDGKEVQYEHSLIVDSMLTTITSQSKTAFPVRFVLQTGDAVVDGRDPKQWNASFVSLINRLTQTGGISYFLAPGNHDVTSAKELTSTNRSKGLSNYLAAVSQLIPSDGTGRRLEGYPTYAFGFGNSFFIAMDSNLAADGTQYDWVVSQLEGLDHNRYENIFAFCHHPPFSSGPHGGTTIEQPAADMRKFYMPLFRKYHVRALFAGHEHFFEHWVENYENASGRKYRLDQIITGGGGAPLYGLKGDPNTSTYEDVYKAEKVKLTHLVRPGPQSGDTPYHYLLVKVDGTELSMEVIGVDWGKGFQPYRSSKTDLGQ
jgi:3',5'-cyclic AMP phosphodiesterase CpdA